MQLTAVESRLREVQGPSQGHTASESPGWNLVSLLLPRALWALQQLRNADGMLPSLWREAQGTGRNQSMGGLLAPHQSCLHGHVMGSLGPSSSSWQCDQSQGLSLW